MNKEALEVLKDFTVLVVEDDEAALNMLDMGLRPFCKKLFLAKDGYEGYDCFVENKIDMVLTDLHMPNLNGFEMIKMILKIKPKQNFIVMTSFDTDENFIKSLEHGALNFIRKPLDIVDVWRSLLLALAGIKESKTAISPRVSVNLNDESVYLDGEVIFLSARNHKLFWLFINNLGRTVSYDLIGEYVYLGEIYSKSAVQMAVKRLKSELPDINLESIPGVGYILK